MCLLLPYMSHCPSFFAVSPCLAVLATKRICSKLHSGAKYVSPRLKIHALLNDVGFSFLPHSMHRHYETFTVDLW